jgi:hypothetical protein
MNDEFYVGYEPDMPPRLAARIRFAARALIASALVLPATLVLSQGRFASAVFEFGETRSFEGTLVEYPYPVLIVADKAGDPIAYWLVGRGKHGAADLVRGRDGQRVRLSGSLIQRETDAMLEVGPNAITAIDEGRARAPEPLRSLGPIVVQGEIVDSKCHLGVMKPGEGTTHRDCAARCLLGSVPPMFVPHDRSGHVNDRSRVSLVSPDGRPFVDGARWAGRAVVIRGELLRRGAQRFLAASPSAIRVLD